MQKIVATILLIAFIGQTFDQGWFYLDYLVQKKAYMARCENKARPELHCDGKCLLMKKIREQERREQQQTPEMKLGSKLEVLSSKSFFATSPEFFIVPQSNAPAAMNSGVPVDRSFPVFHPPAGQA